MRSEGDARDNRVPSAVGRGLRRPHRALPLRHCLPRCMVSELVGEGGGECNLLYVVRRSSRFPHSHKKVSRLVPELNTLGEYNFNHEKARGADMPQLKAMFSLLER